MDATPVRVWRALATTVFKPALRGFFVSDADVPRPSMAVHGFPRPSTDRPLTLH